MDDQSLIAAYLDERAQMVKARKPHRVAQVDLKLAALGHQVEARPEPTPAPPTPPVETATKAPPEHTAAPSPTDHRCHCGRSFRTAAALGSHQRVHRGDDA